MNEAARIDQAPRDAEDYAATVARLAPADPLTPADRYQELFAAVQGGRVFADSKTFVDCVPLRPPAAILEAYRAQRAHPDFDLARFVHAHFQPEQVPASGYVSIPGQPLCAHIDGLWPVLTRQPHEHPAHCSLLPLPNAYVVPGGRFREMYYWDSYFTMLGLAESGRRDLLRSMADNFAWLIDCYGHIPNGNRSYYLSRSQPPVFALMVALFERHGVCAAVRYLPRLRREHAFWMDGAEALGRDAARRHCVRLPDGALLNRYWDDRDTPREEAWLEDVTTARHGRRPAPAVYRDLRAAAASGWDFSSRWCEEDEGLPGTRTTTILPIDLNAFLYALEAQIARLAAAAGEDAVATEFTARHAARRRAIERWLWCDAQGAYVDHDWLHGRPRALCAAATAALYVGAASPDRAARTAAALEARLLEDGGLGTTAVRTGEQWDQPNGWAPLQWLAIRGLARYGQAPLARTIARRWLDTVGSLYERESKLVEKYALPATPRGAMGGGGGEYPLQDGFGWTNGVTRKLLHEAPGNRNHGARAARGEVHRHART